MIKNHTGKNHQTFVNPEMQGEERKKGS